MPQNFIYETAITLDHELNELRLDTTVTSIATAAKRAGFTETTTDQSKPYRRFTATADQVKFRKPKGQRRVGGAAAQKAALKTTVASE
jgi:hypothetical protein